MKIRGKSMTLRTILTLSLTGFVAGTIILLAAFSYTIFSRIMTEQIAKSRVDVLAQISERISSVSNSISVLSNFYYFNLPSSVSLYSDEPLALPEQEQILDSLARLDEISSKTVEAAAIDFHYVMLLNNGFTYASDGNPEAYTLQKYRKKLWYSDIVSARGKPVWISTYKNFAGDDSYVFSIARSIVDAQTGEHEGIFIANVGEITVSRTYENLISDNAIYVVDQNGSIISHSNKDMLAIHFYDMEKFAEIYDDANFKIIKKSDRKFLFSKHHNSEMNWLVVEEIPLNLLLRPLGSVRSGLLLIGAAVFALCSLLIGWLSAKTVRPLAQLCGEFELVGQNDDIVVFDATGWREIDRICEEGNYMSGRIRSLLNDVKKQEKQKRRAEIAFMQAQMNPHFVYNTLFSIKCLVDMGDREKALEIIDAFTALLKNILSNKHEYISVSEELGILGNYVTLQKCRYGDIFDFTADCPDNCAPLQILPMIIQPLIENAIFHGLNGKNGRGRILLAFRLEDDFLKITVEDNGLGMSRDTLNGIWNGQRVPGKENSNMIGVRNIADRLRLCYSDKGDITIESEPEHGTRVTIHLPCSAVEGGNQAENLNS